jgi:uncharacterized damage-inducible protein DinB
MTLSEVLLLEFDHEMAGTRKTLERVPDDKFGWKPHAKSMPMGRLAGHVALNPSWGAMIINNESLDLAPPGAPPYRPSFPDSRAAALELFDKGVAELKAALIAASDQQLMQTWSLLYGGNALYTGTRMAALRGIILNHTIHHRAQLGVYLRLNDIPVPGMYGPSADETSAHEEHA